MAFGEITGEIVGHTAPRPTRRIGRMSLGIRALALCGALVASGTSCSSGNESSQPQQSTSQDNHNSSPDITTTTSARAPTPVTAVTLANQLSGVAACEPQTPYPRSEDTTLMRRFLTTTAPKAGWSEELNTALLSRLDAAQGSIKTYQITCSEQESPGITTMSVDGSGNVLYMGVATECLSEEARASLETIVEAARDAVPQPVIYAQSCLDETRPPELLT